MKKYTSFVLVVFSIVFVSMLPSGASAFAGSGGTPENPFQITNCVQLQEMNNDLNASYILINDINCANTVNWNSREGFVPIGNSSSPFLGTFDGQNHKITGLFINRPSAYYVGLFDSVGSDATISNVGLVDANITGKDYVGGLVSYNQGTITNSYSTGSVSGGAYMYTHVGGLVGGNQGTIINSFATGSVSGTSQVGGLVGWNFGVITNSYATGSVTGSDIGGLVGDNNLGGVITNSFATGSVSGSNSVGGLVGQNNQGVITNSFATGSVSGGAYMYTHVGGLVGHSYHGIITNSFATGSVSGNGYSVGGLIGANNQGTITNSFATGSVSGSNSVGGLVGQNINGIITNSYWDIETSGQSESSGGTGKTTAKMMQQFTYENWNFVNIWAIKEGISYPYFLWQIIDTVVGLQQIINTLPGDVFSDEIKNSLVSKIDNALSLVDKEKDEVAINVLQAFINQVEAQRGKKIAEGIADMLTAYAKNVIDSVRIEAE